MSVDISRALAVRGERGTNSEDLCWLAEAARGRRKIIELGAYHGASTRAMLDNSEAHVWCVDSWRGSESGAGLATNDGDYAIFLENIRDVKWRVTVLRMFTREAAKILPVRFFDMVFIDACHSYEAVKFDVMHYVPVLNPGGLLCGHDAGREGLDRAVEELVDSPMRAATAIWWAHSPFLRSG